MDSYSSEEEICEIQQERYYLPLVTNFKKSMIQFTDIFQ